jgi:hypothetical protein
METGPAISMFLYKVSKTDIPKSIKTAFLQSFGYKSNYPGGLLAVFFDKDN